MKKIIGMLFAGLFVFQIAGTSFAAAGLSDIAGHKYQTAIEYLYKNKIISGYSDGTFKADIKINRAELLKILVGGAGFTDPDAAKYKNCFPDVKTQWYAKYVCFAKEKNWVKGYEGGLFKPEQPSTKVEAIKMLMHSQGFPITDKTTAQSIYSDVDFKQWFGPYMFVAEAMQIVDIAGAKYGPMDFITRGEISNNIYRAMLIIKYKVGNFDEVLIEMSPDKEMEVIKDPVVNQQFDAPVLTASSSNPSMVLLKWTAPAKTGDSALKSYVLDYKVDNDIDYKSTNYAVEFYDAKVKTDGGIILTVAPATMYHFKVKAVNVNGQSSAYSSVGTITTAQPLEPGAPTVEKVSQTFSSITLKVSLPKYTGDSALDALYDSFIDPNDGFGQGGFMSIAGNNIVDSWTVKYNFSPNKDSLEQPNYEFSFWVNNKNGKVGEKVVAKFAGLSTNPDRPTVTTAAIAKNSIGFNVKKPDYTGSMPIEMYYYTVDSSSGEMPLDKAGSYGVDYFEKDMKGVLTIGNALLPNTTYTISFWVKNLNGKHGDKITKTVTTAAN